MALIVEYQVVADMYAVGDTAISAGMLVELNAAGQVIPAAGGQASTVVLGVAGDSALAAQGRTTAYSAQVTLGADGANTRWTENRVSDFYDETAASNKITVYNGGGKFWISDDLHSGGTLAINANMEASAVAGSWDQSAVTLGARVGICVSASTAYPSGVPGTAVDGSISLGNYFCVSLRI
jgi:hypothetical protein